MISATMMTDTMGRIVRMRTIRGIAKPIGLGISLHRPSCSFADADAGMTSAAMVRLANHELMVIGDRAVET
ncbi:hypothetical protein WR25_25001 [Diploscapter pachys]|uniref:Uncharacterized protein n=1 Tax=Diploscapter pachys TaxID=2018661 RepID=A0A2A2LTP2_9BILA|nr:hypothetical protein WR25_25001 [Diploscapter pachys]